MNEFENRNLENNDLEAQKKASQKLDQAKIMAARGAKEAVSIWQKIVTISGKIIAILIGTWLVTMKFLGKTLTEMKESKSQGSSNAGFGGGYVDHDMPNFAEHRRPESRNNLSRSSGSSEGRFGRSGASAKVGDDPKSGGTSNRGKSIGRRGGL